MTAEQVMEAVAEAFRYGYLAGLVLATIVLLLTPTKGGDF